jgi:leader peptidase (prepilin peptidase) / N-methyltransferase
MPTLGITLVIAGVLGLVCGAFVNTFLLRTPDGLRFTVGRRKCVTCARPMQIKDHLPLVSYVAMKGKCRACKTVIPWQYPALEVAMTVLFVGFAWQIVAVNADVQPLSNAIGVSFGLFVRNALMAMLLVPIFMFDYRASVIPDRLSIPAMIVALSLNTVLGVDPISMLLGGCMLGSFFAIQYLASKGQWVGGGDIRMAMVMGFLLGPVLGLFALLVAYVLGALVGLYLLLTRRRDLHSHVPFGTFMVVGTFISLFFGHAIVGWYLEALK